MEGINKTSFFLEFLKTSPKKVYSEIQGIVNDLVIQQFIKLQSNTRNGLDTLFRLCFLEVGRPTGLLGTSFFVVLSPKEKILNSQKRRTVYT